ncbi:MAG: hypothetical protein HKO65_02185 [Gemmatimonadetes bacterium]|nr:hypothetical protein [Gemmatimonadota bacterium]NNM03885.1 hypothetical protein [Gemmatimonadota bacterium]
MAMDVLLLSGIEHPAGHGGIARKRKIFLAESSRVMPLPPKHNTKGNRSTYRFMTSGYGGSGASRARTGDLWLAKPISLPPIFMNLANFWGKMHEFGEPQIRVFTRFMNANM